MGKKLFLPFTLLCFAVGFFLSFIFSNMGYLRYTELAQSRDELEIRLRELAYEIDVVERQITRLTDDNDHLIRLARRELGMIIPGERVIKIIEGERVYDEQ